ncbi:MAG: hypothetical protein IPG04_07680 [Polyangiaceae bacterium]|nr:hypothetical protein [Polyangiaceae bacterium]
MFAALQRLFRRKGLPPLLVRLRDEEGFVEGSVELVAVWQPSGRRQVTRCRAAQGLCILPWGGGRRVELHFVHARGQVRLTAHASDAECGEALLARLEGPQHRADLHRDDEARGFWGSGLGEDVQVAQVEPGG